LNIERQCGVKDIIVDSYRAGPQLGRNAVSLADVRGRRSEAIDGVVCRWDISSKSVNGMTQPTGPKISSERAFMSCLVSTGIVGSTK
jgi:hypothetical protein